MTTLVVLQPGYLPWLGFFDQLDKADVFVYYDDVQYDKGGWRNRNRIKTPHGRIWLTVPVLIAGHFGQAINEVAIDTEKHWARKHLRTIEQNYHAAPYFDDYFPALSALLDRPWRLLADLDVTLVEEIARWLRIETTIYKVSSLSIDGRRNERLINLCRHFGADRYLSGDAARSYLDQAIFDAAEISVEWQDYEHPKYTQLHGDFISHLSVLDLLLNCGEESLAIIRNSGVRRL